MKADCAVKRMCKDEKNHERVGQRYTEKLGQKYQVQEKYHPCFSVAALTIYSLAGKQAMSSF